MIEGYAAYYKLGVPVEDAAQAGDRVVGDARLALGPRRLAVHPGSGGPTRQEAGVAMDKPEDVLFSPAVKAEQMRLGSRSAFEGRDWQYRDHRRSAAVPGRHRHLLLCDGQRRRPALCPAPRRTAGLPEADRQPHARLRRFRRQPAVHHLGAPARKTTAPTSSSRTSPPSSASSCGAAPASSRATSS